MRRLLLIIAGLLVALTVIVPASAVYFVLFTQSGLRFAIAQIPHKIGDIQLEIVNVTGTVAHGIQVERVEIDHHLVHLRFEGIQGHVTMLPLLWQTIRVNDGYVRSALIQVKRRTKPPIPSEPIFLPRWLIISAEHARVGHALLTVPNGFSMESTELVGAFVVRHKTIRFFEAQGQIGTAHVSAIGTLGAADPLKIDADASIDWSPESQPVWKLYGTAKGDLNKLIVNAHTLAPFRSDVTGQALDLTRQWHWLGNANVHNFDLRSWGINSPLGIMTGKLAIHGNGSGFGARGLVNPTGLKVGEFDAQFEGTYAKRVLTARHMEARHPSSGAHATGSGTFEIVPHGPLVNIHGNWQSFRWPLVGKIVPFHSPSGEFTLQGILPYTVHTSGIATVLDYPSVPATIDGVLGKDSFTYSRAEVDLFHGHASVSGKVVWGENQHTWTIDGDLKDIDPSYFRPEWPGQLDFHLAVDGRSFEPAGPLAIEFRNLGGKVRGVTASGGGKLFHSGTTWDFDTVRVGLGKTNIDLDGHISDRFDLRFRVAAEDLSLLAADSRGQLNANGTIHGTLRQPTVVATAHGSNIHHADMTLESLDADIDFDPQPGHPSKIDARLRKLVYDNRTLDTASLTLSGDPSSYEIRVESRSADLEASARANGPFVDGLFQGKLTALALNAKDALHLELQHPTELTFGAQRFRLEWACLLGKPASICAGAEWTPAQWTATVAANHLPINTLTAGLPSSINYQGTMGIQARVFGNDHEPVQGELRVQLTDAQLQHRALSHRLEHTTRGSGTLNLRATRDAITADATLEDGQVGTIRAKMQSQRGAANWQDMPVKGEIHAQTAEFNLISVFIPDIDRAAGHLTADINVGGTLGTPILNGQLKVTDGELDLYQVNLGLRNLNLEARLTDRGIDFTGAAQVGQGSATTTGHLEWRDSLPYGKLELQGINLRVVDLPEAQIDASPSLDFKVDGQKIDVTGSVKVPYAKIEPRDLTNAVRSSSDEVIVGAETENAASRFQVLSAINLILGDKVNVKTSGLSGRLTGSINVRSGFDPLTRATGELSILDGKYVAYAHNMDIERGRLLFTGGAVDNPGIDIRATRKFPDVTAGVNVRGTLIEPRVSFFSEPSLPQSEIVSLMLSGTQLAQNNAGRQANASNEALVQGGAILASQLGSYVGIQSVGVETDLLTNDTSLVLGRYLSPRLYVSYGVSITENLNVLKLRYSLGDHWTIKTEVGQARGADLVFTIDK